MHRDERNGRIPTDGNIDCRAAAQPDLPVERPPDPPRLCSASAPPTPLFRDRACPAACSRREALQLCSIR